MEILYKKMWEIDKYQARKMLIESYQKTGSIKKTAYLCGILECSKEMVKAVGKERRRRAL